MRIDKFVSNLGFGSRKQVTWFIKSGSIGVNGEIVHDAGHTIHFGDTINIGEDSVVYQSEVTVMLHKPAGYVSSAKAEAWHLSYLELLTDCPYWEILHIVGRLDVDTTGLLILTINGTLTHEIIHPKKEIWKKYRVTFRTPLSDKDIYKLKTGVIIDEHLSLPARYSSISETQGYLSISEWRFHQIKKMFEAIGNEVISLHRESIWWLHLGTLQEGKWNYLSNDEIALLKTEET